MILRKSFLLLATLALSSTVLAQGGPPDNAGADRGKAMKEAARDNARAKRAGAESEREAAEEEAKRQRDKAETDRDDAERQREKAEEEAEARRERAEEERKRAREQAEDEAEERSEGDENDQTKSEERKGPQQTPPGLKKKDAPPGAGKGSETGQQKRQENARPWWDFWSE